MNGRRVALIAGAGCVLLILLLVVVAAVGLFAFNRAEQTAGISQGPPAVVTKAVEGIPTLAPQPPRAESQPAPQIPSSPQLPGIGPDSLMTLYDQTNPGVVNIRVQITRGGLTGGGAGSGFILDNDGHIVTNNHVVADATRVVVVFYDGTEAEAEVIGTDGDSDLAVVRVDQLAEGAHPLPLGDSDRVQPGEWVIAIGNPFEFGGTMTVGIVSAVGRIIPSLTDFSIPQAIQTDAAINPGNSGGPLLDLAGEVIGVNAQIQTNGTRANAGVGFSIPSNIVNLVAPALIEKGSYEWPWLGVSGTKVDLTIMELNNLDSQRGAYIHLVLPNSPASEAGLQGSSSQDQPVGGDVIIKADGKPIADFSDLLIDVAFKKPGDKMDLTILRNGQPQTVTVTLARRPANLSP
ncbi:MAG: S1C family serine protease [Anaerolineae bacterium]